MEGNVKANVGSSLPEETHALPDGWEIIDSLAEEARIEGVSIALAGYAATHSASQQVATGSAASCYQKPERIAYFELLERIAILEAIGQPAETSWNCLDLSTQKVVSKLTSAEIFPPMTVSDSYQISKSNGVAIGSSFEQAALHALSESVERHLVLLSWYGAVKPERVSFDWPEELHALSAHYRLEQYSLGSVNLFQAQRRFTATVCVLWPLEDRATKNGSERRPVIHGFGAAASTAEACAKSFREAIQRLGFISGEDPVTDEPAFQARPDYHQDYFLHPERRPLLKSWLSGAFFRPHYQNRLPPLGVCRLIDITPSSYRSLWVVKATVPGILPLVFGRYRHPLFPELPDERLIHPIV